MPETFPPAVGAWITCARDLERNDVYPSFAQFSDDLDNQTDLEIFHEVEEGGFRVVHEQGTNSGGQRFFPFPFDTQDVINWVFNFENDYTIRGEIRDDFEAVLDAPVYDDEVTPTADAESVCEEREDQILEFVDELLWGDRWIDLDGSDLLFMSPAGGPLPLSASHVWITPTVGAVHRPFRAQRLQPTVAKLYCDGRLGLTWPTQVEIEESPEVARPLPDLLVVDLARCELEDALELYDIAYLHLHRPGDGELTPDAKALETVARARAGAIATHVVVGRSAIGAGERIAELARTGGEWGWTVPRVAKAGDLVLFYLLNPEGQFVATGRLLSNAQPGSSKEGAGKYVADVGQVHLLAVPIGRLDAVDQVSGWGWPRQPHTATTVPQEHIEALTSLIRL